MAHQIDLQTACQEPLPFKKNQLLTWARLPLSYEENSSELTLRFVDKEEITALNKTYRKKDKPTNVLAFPSQIPQAIKLDYLFLGDVIICPMVLKEEAEAFNKPLNAHWAHIIIHGILHLLGFDHEEEEETKRMQTMEIKLLAQLGFANPYFEGEIVE